MGIVIVEACLVEQRSGVMRNDGRLSRMLHVLIHMARHDGPMTSETIARMLGTYPVLIRRTMSGLRDVGYVKSEKGHGGGWTIAADLNAVTLLDVHRKDYEDRRRRQAEGTAKAKAAGLYRGRPANKARNAAISSLLSDGRSWREIMDATGCSRTLLAKIARDRRLLKAEPGAGVAN